MSFFISKIKTNLSAFTGRIGPTGPIGVNGTQGFTGILGIEGLSGILGVQGFNGFTGGPSDFGLQGSQGLLGDQGFLGPSGNSGPLGNQGLTGLNTVSIGDTGPIGFQGESGPFGLQGFLGDIGMSGLQGLQGVTGSIPNFQSASGLIFRPSIGGIVETNLLPVFNLIQGQPGPNGCTGIDIDAWFTGDNLSNISIIDGNIATQPAQFVPQISGIYLFTYNIDITDDDDDASFMNNIMFECQVGPGVPLTIPGSRASITVDDLGNHVSHNFLYQALTGEEIGVYIANSLMDGICLNFRKSSFVAKLLQPLVFS